MTKNESSLDDVDTAQKKEQKKLFQKKLGLKQNFEPKKNFYITSWVNFFLFPLDLHRVVGLLYSGRAVFSESRHPGRPALSHS